MEYWLTQVLNGLSFGMLLFFLAAGLTLTLGVMRVINLTHGSFYLIGAYVAYHVVERTGSFSLGAVAASLAGLLLGVVVFALLQWVGSDALRQTLLTFGLIFIVADIALVIWGGSPLVISKPEAFSGTMQVGDFSYPSYRVFVLGIGILMAIGLELLQRRTLVGAMVRSVVDDVEMAGGIGRNAFLIAGGTFLAGAALAGLSGAMGGALIGTYPGADLQVLLLALIVVIIGGMGSLTGSLVGALAVGLIDAIGRALVPELGASLMFLLMLGTLVFRPAGLFGKQA